MVFVSSQSVDVRRQRVPIGTPCAGLAVEQSPRNFLLYSEAAVGFLIQRGAV
jgi:hypothetical protein